MHDDDPTPGPDDHAPLSCDRCGARSYVSVDLSGAELLFCHHHFVANEAALALVGAVVTRDDRAELTRA